MRSNKRIWRAFLIAPLVSVPALAVAMAVVIAVKEPRQVPIIAAGVLHVMGLFTLGLPLAYAIAFGIGLPVYWLLGRYDQLTLLPILAITGALGGVGIALSLSYIFGSRWAWSNFLLGVPVGAAVGLTFWFIGVREPRPERVA